MFPWENDVLNALESAIESIEKERFQKIKTSGEKLIHSICIYRDPLLIRIAVDLYATGKILERLEYKRKNEAKQLANKIKPLLSKLYLELKLKKINNLQKTLQNIEKIVEKVDKRLTEYHKDIFTKAKIKIGFLMYRHGLPLSIISNTLGISLEDLIEYVGQTESFEEDVSSEEVTDRIENVRKFFEE